MTEQRHRAPGRATWPPASVLVRQVVGPAAGAVALMLLLALVVSPGSFRVRLLDEEPTRVEQAAPVASTAPVPTSTPTLQAAPPRQDPDPVDPGEDAPTVAAQAALTELLRRRDAAVASKDATAWERTAGPDAGQAFTVLSGLPVTRFESSLVADSLRPAAPDDGTDPGADPGTDGSFEARVDTTYELADGPAVVRTDTVVLTSTEEGWDVVGWEPFPSQGDIGTAAPWDLGTVRPTVGERAVVLSWAETGAGDETAQADLAAVAEADRWGRQVSGWADRGAVTVDSYLGTGWPRRTLVLLPATDAQYDALVPGPRSETNGVFAAVTTDVRTPDGSGDVVVVNPAARAELVEETWQVTITHELAHVASGARYGDTQEVWLAEGLADLIGWSPMVPATVSRERVASRLLERIGDDGATLDGLPANESFSDPDADVVGDAYESSWLAVLLLQDELGVEGLLRMYEDASDGPGSARQRTDGALRTATGEGREAFEERWRTYLTGLAAG